ncbi:MAG: bacterioferritin-associated ferredoxin [Planctomycetaceae bacterium]
MQSDDKLCYCFHISQRKVLNYLRVHKPRVASQLSDCGGAGTGCGWCIPFLKRHFKEWKSGSEADVEMTAAEYALARASYVKAGNGRPPAGAEPLPD